jgi:hypothetical protein
VPQETNKQTDRQTQDRQTDKQTDKTKKKKKLPKFRIFLVLVWFGLSVFCVLCCCWFCSLLWLKCLLRELTPSTPLRKKKKTPLVFLLVFFLIKKRLTKCGGGCLFFTMEFRVEKEFDLVFTVRTSREAGLF